MFDNDYGNVELATRVYENWRDRTKHPGFGAVAFIKGQQQWDTVPLQCADLLAGVIRRDPRTKDSLKSKADRVNPPIFAQSISMVGLKATALSGRGTIWSIARAKEIDELIKKWKLDLSTYKEVSFDAGPAP